MANTKPIQLINFLCPVIHDFNHDRAGGRESCFGCASLLQYCRNIAVRIVKLMKLINCFYCFSFFLEYRIK